jgi:cytochrome d ubiquinol oxidase subunit II
MFTYALLGCCWLVLKTEGDLQRRLHQLVWPLTVILLLFMAVISVWTPLADATVAKRWFSAPLLYRLMPVPFLVLICAACMYVAVKRRHDAAPFFLALMLVLLGYIGLLVSIWPYAIPTSLTLWEAAAPHSSQVFTLVGAAIIIPIILIYTTAGYWVFRGKVVAKDSAY